MVRHSGLRYGIPSYCDNGCKFFIVHYSFFIELFGTEASASYEAFIVLWYFSFFIALDGDPETVMLNSFQYQDDGFSIMLIALVLG